MRIAVLGAGNWGTTAALLLNGNGHKVILWEFFEELALDIRERRENIKYLKGFPIPEVIEITSNLSEAAWNAEMIVFALPSSIIRRVASDLQKTGITKNTILVSLSKGLEYETVLTLTEIITSETENRQTVAMSGPCIASEVARKLPTTIVSASEIQEAASVVQDAFITPDFRVYTSDDPLGVQIGGALKNIIAIAAGINDGLGYGTNAKSALINRGIVEMKRFGISRGAKLETFNGLSGIGDLITTCFSPHSRNRRVGEEVAKGKPLDKVIKDMVMIAEGVPTTKTVYEFSLANGIDMPITRQVYSILFEGVSPETAVMELMMREKKPEDHTFNL